jgi:tyrosine-protein phosphatase SIW14
LKRAISSVALGFHLLSAFVLLPFVCGDDSVPLPAGVTPKDVPRFIQLADGVFRGGQPSGKGFDALKGIGIRTVVNFREEKDEREEIERRGMKYFYIPLNASQGIPDRAIRQFFEIVRDPKNHPVFFHCRRGADRTGAMAGFYRVEFQGWDGAAASKEARRVGMRWWYGNLRKQIESFDPNRY